MNDPFAQDHEVEPLIDDFTMGTGKGALRRKEDQTKNQFGESYTYVSSAQYSHPAETQAQPLQSQTYGGLGPANPNSGLNIDGDGSKLKSNKPHFRMMRNCTTCLRNSGCVNHTMVLNEGPNADYYRDDFNDQPLSCSIGTTEEDGIWMNRNDGPGSIMAVMVWFLFIYSAVTITFLAETGGIHGILSLVYVTLTGLSLASHAKTQFSDPGTVPASAQPVEAYRKMNPQMQLNFCSQCQSFKPPLSHHCRICNRCVSRMDHHCPWMNNCIGAGNFKHFILFLVYTWLCNALALILLGWNYFFCVSEECTFTILLVQLARITTFLSTCSMMFTSSMIMNVTYGIITGIGTIDRLKKKAMDTMQDSEEESISLKDIFGIAGWYTWFLPIDPVFEDFDRVLGFSTPQRLLREQMKDKVLAQTYSTSSVGVESYMT